ncbi:hypothetical protein Y032_0005g2379 [Ancylostoma ceylanicum]|uniref:Uncharacterized protein n=1 Tax=Ancylostoma ceylanicum TaxID=53326 RepID=A0A016VRG0_9BILA|nr:hypothetical protein Y032_0005g2379 [Ancylostoma ceylanicum]
MSAVRPLEAFKIRNVLLLAHVMQQLFTTQRSLKLLKGRGPPRFSLRRYQHILDLLATLIPTTYSLSHRSDKNPVFGRVKVPAFWSRGGSAPKSGYLVLAARHDSNVG